LTYDQGEDCLAQNLSMTLESSQVSLCSHKVLFYL
jgi:hypothetical protein